MLASWHLPEVQKFELTEVQRTRLEQLRVAIREAEAEALRKEGQERVEVVDAPGWIREEMVAIIQDGLRAETSETAIVDQTRALVGAGGPVVVPIVTRAHGRILMVSWRGRALDAPS